MKCVVSVCPNRSVPANRGVFKRPKKRFFSFPKDPARVKVWLAALRETDKQDYTEQHFICEDHFLPEDISKNGISIDAIPIMPPCLDGGLGMISSWGAESYEEEDQWAITTAGDEDEAVEVGNASPVIMQPPAPDQPKQDPDIKKDEGAETTSDSLFEGNELLPSRALTRQDMSLGVLTQRFLQLLLMAPDGSLDVRQVMSRLHTRRRRIYDITNVLDGIELIEKDSINRVKWIGKYPISSFMPKSQQKFQKEMDNLKLVEDTLDTLIKSCAQQLFDMTDDRQNSALAYVTHEDISRLGAFQEQTVIVVKAPEETKLEVPAPKEDSIQVHLKGSKGPITVLICDIGTDELVTGEKRDCFLTLEESRIKTATLHTESSNPKSATQSA